MYSLFKKIVPCLVFPGADFDLFSKPTTTEALGRWCKNVQETL
jgi:hypothetical protein